jgi:TP901 family phage tail tape measure protein
MAGYLGTLFMGGVGLRLVLPPASQFGRLINQMQTGLKKAGTSAQSISERFARERRNRLQADVKAAQKLTKSLEQQGDVDKMTRLKALLKKIETEHGVSMARAIARTKNLSQVLNPGKNDLNKGLHADLDAAMDAEPAMSRFGKILDFTIHNVTGLGRALISVGKFIAETWVNAIQRSTMLLITFGFQLGIVTRGVMEFEKELVNANSIFQTTNKELFEMSDELIRVGHQYGITYQEGSKVLYQFASAGLTAEEAMTVLNDTLTLTMAVQGDANTLGKLLVQTIKGFGLEMESAAALTDKFAYTINKSLIEWKDLSSAVKFAMPFFVSAGQSVDQLLGSLQILTDRALEAGIAGRGLRQAIAQFVEHADDNNAAFRKLGVEILDTEGNMRALTDIALQFNDALGEDVTNMDVMMALMEDLNIRGATAFVHLAQNAEEFQIAVDDLANSQGAANEMAEYQQQSLTNQVQLLKNAIFSVFYLSDANYEATGAINGFDFALKKAVISLKERFLVTMADGSTQLTEFGFKIRDIAIKFIDKFADLLLGIVDIFVNLSNAGNSLFHTLDVLFSAVQGLIDVLAGMDPETVKLIFQIWLLNNLFGTTGGLIMGAAFAFQHLKYWLEDIHPWLASTAEILVIIGGVLSGGVIGGILGAAGGALTGAAVGATYGAFGGPAGIVGGALAGAVTGAGYGFATGVTVGGVAGGMTTAATLNLSDSMVSGLYNDSAAGDPSALPTYSGGGTGTMYVGNLVASNDNLNYRASDSAYVSQVV